MFEAVIRALISLALLVAVGVIVIWFLGILGLALPPHLITIFWAILVLVAILILYRVFKPYIGGWMP